jgi:Fe-S-cluster-containing dehydrogenase component
VQYGFLIDHHRCIGCHACTVACKAENDVPVGSFRTWVKYSEKGTFPEVKRHFAVLRCNHCTQAPCVTICPVNALDKRADGIVDLDRDACIGCRACMQACPYDALYLNEDSGAVEKCHYCAHRVESGLQPACVVVCPEQAIISGDLHDTESPIAAMVRDLKTEVRRPEQRTGPNVHYAGHEPSILQPGVAERPETFLWSQRPSHKPEPWPASLPVAPNNRTVLDTEHKVEWGWPVGAYLVTKGIAAGVAMLAPFAAGMGAGPLATGILPDVVALIFTLITMMLLAGDLARPMLFLRILTRPNWDSWLVRGAVILGAFSAAIAGGLVLRLAGLEGAADILRWSAAILAVPAAGYTALLFGQCEGRDLWQSHLLLPHLLAQALLCGAAVFLPMAPGSRPLQILLALAALSHLALALAERYRNHETDNARQGAAFLGVVAWGPVRLYRDGLLIGGVLAAALAVPVPAAAAVAALIGLSAYELAFVRAGQLPPNS